MKKTLIMLTAALLVVTVMSCITVSEPEPEPSVLEEVSWNELANKSEMAANDNRYVTLKVQFLGPDAAAIPAQMLYAEVQSVVLMNHIEPGASYDEEVVTSLDSFLVGLKPGDKTDELMNNGTFGDIIEITGTTKYVDAGFGTFQHLLINVDDFEVLSK